jgi:hypothetical protein
VFKYHIPKYWFDSKIRKCLIASYPFYSKTMFYLTSPQLNYTFTISLSYGVLRK